MDSRQGSIEGAAVQLSHQLPRLFLVTRREVVSQPRFVERAAAALLAGGRGCALQLRAHGLKGRSYWEIALQVADAARDAGAQLWINDRIDIAAAVRADGVQLGAASLPTEEARRILGHSAWIGRSVHSAEDALRALDSGADLALLGHVYPTSTHPGATPLGLDEVRGAAGRPVVG
ncbi:MAG TPA: thiamine phosphate synthase, partial [Gemmatimonadota bacterium]|nr:thiamine phosphate synthase [Gemmatimonadota bacterium]